MISTKGGGRTIKITHQIKLFVIAGYQIATSTWGNIQENYLFFESICCKKEFCQIGFPGCYEPSLPQIENWLVSRCDLTSIMGGWAPAEKTASPLLTCAPCISSRRVGPRREVKNVLTGEKAEEWSSSLKSQKTMNQPVTGLALKALPYLLYLCCFPLDLLHMPTSNIHRPYLFLCWLDKVDL